MKSNYLTTFLMTAVMTTGVVLAQVIDPPCEIPGATLCDNIDAYTSGEAIGPQATWWSTWSGTEGAAEDGLVTSDYSFSGENSMQVSEGGSNDVILKLGNKSTGKYRLEWMYYVPDDKTGYYNIQQSETPGLGWNLELLFGLSAVGVPSSPGEGTISIPAASGDFTYPVDEWFKIEHIIDLDANTCEVYVAGEFVASVAYTGNIGSIDFYSVDANCRYYVDDILFTDVVNVTYQVDITNYLAGGATISDGGMRVGGNFSDLGSDLPNWSPADDACAMTDIGGNIWEITVSYPLGSIGSTQQYKYVNGDWFPTGENEYDDGAASLFGILGCGGDNREVIVPENDATYLYCWEQCSACVSEGEPVSVTYQVDITNYLAEGAIIAEGGMRVGGNFGDLGTSLPNWAPSDPACAMTDIGGNIWEITVEYPAGSVGGVQQFKFVNGDWAPTGENEYDDTPSLFSELGCGGDNREQIIPESATTYTWCWEQCSACEVVCVSVPPSDIYVDDISSTGATVNWTEVSGADQYVGALWNLTTGVIRKFRVSDVGSYTLPSVLTPSTTYGVRIKTACLGDEVFSSYSEFVYFTTDPLRIGDIAQDIKLYPNPNNGTFRIQLNGYAQNTTQIEVMNMAGQLIATEIMDAGDNISVIDMQLQNIAPGNYIVRVINGETISILPLIID